MVVPFELCLNGGVGLYKVDWEKEGLHSRHMGWSMQSRPVWLNYRVRDRLSCMVKLGKTGPVTDCKRVLKANPGNKGEQLKSMA